MRLLTALCLNALDYVRQFIPSWTCCQQRGFAVFTLVMYVPGCCHTEPKIAKPDRHHIVSQNLATTCGRTTGAPIRFGVGSCGESGVGVSQSQSQSSASVSSEGQGFRAKDDRAVRHGVCSARQDQDSVPLGLSRAGWPPPWWSSACPSV